MPTPRWLHLEPLSHGADAANLLLRLVTGAFLIHGVWDNITETARMQEFVAFLSQHGFWRPQLMAPLSVWLQFAVGVAFFLGVLARWAGLLCSANFLVACAMVHWGQDFRGWWPALVLVLIGLVVATHGAGRLSLDAWLARSPRAAPSRSR